jgi:hypothetical protein
VEGETLGFDAEGEGGEVDIEEIELFESVLLLVGVLLREYDPPVPELPLPLPPPNPPKLLLKSPCLERRFAELLTAAASSAASNA